MAQDNTFGDLIVLGAVVAAGYFMLEYMKGKSGGSGGAPLAEVQGPGSDIVGYDDDNGS